MRHNRLRNWVCKMSDVAMLNPAMEKLGLLGPTDESKRRPGDVSIPLWRYGRGLAIDVAVICPVAPSHVNEAVPCETYAAKRKHNRYDAGFRGSRFDFAAMVFETSGAVNVEDCARLFVSPASANVLAILVSRVVRGLVLVAASSLALRKQF